MGNVEKLPSREEVAAFVNESIDAKKVLSAGEVEQVHRMAQQFLMTNNTEDAWKLLLAAEK